MRWTSNSGTFKKKFQACTATLPGLEGGLHILASAVILREGRPEGRYSPTLVEIAQVVARIGEQSVPMIPVPDARQYGNRQSTGCSWVLYKLHLAG